MASVDLNLDYKEAQKKIEASKAYKELKTQYDDTVKSAGESFESKKQDLTKSLNQVKEQQKRFQREIKTQFEQLLDINNVTGGKGSNSIAYVKKLLLKTIKSVRFDEKKRIVDLLNIFVDLGIFLDGSLDGSYELLTAPLLLACSVFNCLTVFSTAAFPPCLFKLLR